MIYAIQAGENGPIKFGIANNPHARRAELQTANHCDLRLLVAASCHDWNERFIHDYLAKDRVRGEWFKPSYVALGVVEFLRLQERYPSAAHFIALLTHRGIDDASTFGTYVDESIELDIDLSCWAAP